MKSKEDIIANMMAILLLCVAAILVVSLKFGYNRDGYCEVTGIEKVQNVHGDKDGFQTDLRYYVYTDAGVFQIETSGVNAYAYGLQLIGKDFPKKLHIKTRGARVEWIGLYPNIIEIIEDYE